MKTTYHKIKALYSKMGCAEKKIADWLINQQSEILSLSISEFAEICDCSEATVVRFARRLSFSGYQELKLTLASESSNKNINPIITKNDSCYEVFEKVTSDIYYTFELTKQSLNPESLEHAANAIINARHIAIFGLGNSSAVALDAQHKFLRAGCNVVSYSDNHMQSISASHLKPGDVALGISHSGSSIDIVEALKISREYGAKTICITNQGKSPIVSQSDIVLTTSAEETKYSILALNSRITQLAIIDSIYFYMVSQKEKESLNAIKRTEHSLTNKKY